MARRTDTTKFPGESAEYRRARNNLLRAEVKLRKQIAAVTEQRRRLPAGGEVKTDYVFDASPPGDREFKQVRLSELFAPGKPTLFLYNFMFTERVGSMTPCPSCTSIIDGVDGASPHIEQRINFSVVAISLKKKNSKHKLRRGMHH